MPPIVRSILFSPLTMAFGLVTLVGIGVVVGIFGQMAMDQSKAQKKELAQQAEKQAAAAAAAKATPQLQKFQPKIEDDPLKMLYIPLGEEMTVNLGRSTHFVMLEVTLGTRFGPNAEALIKANTVSLRSDIMAMVSEYNFATASKPEFKDMLSARIRDHVNGIMRTKAPIRILVDEVQLTRLIAN
jgi:flagellar basal body-associated protein FliL